MENILGLDLDLLNEQWKKSHSLELFSVKEIEQLLIFSDIPRTQQDITEIFNKSKGAMKVRAAMAGLLHEYQAKLAIQPEKTEQLTASINSIVKFVVSNCKLDRPDDHVPCSISNPKYISVWHGTHRVGRIKNQNYKNSLMINHKITF